MRLFCARHRVLGRKQAATGDAWGSQVSCSFLFGWVAVRENRSWRGPHALRVLSALFAVKPAYVLPSHTHTASSDIKQVLVLDQLQAPPCHWLRTIWKSRAAQAFATTIDWRSDGVSNRRSTRKLDRRLSGTRTRVRVAESCAKRPTASRWWTRRSIEVVTVYEKAREVSVCRWQWCCGHYSGQGCRKNTSSRFENSPNWTCVKFWLYSQASVPRQL